MKDVTKQLSEKATRFLPVDMKDRLKTIFNRGPSPATSSSDEDVPDYSAIFNANKAPGQKKVRFNGPLEPRQLAEPPARATMSKTGMQRADDIEDAEIVPQQFNEPLVRAEQEEPMTASESAESESIAEAPAPEAPAPKESFAQRAAAKAKALAASAEETITSRIAAASRSKAPASSDDDDESFAHRGPSKKAEAPKAASTDDEPSFAYRAAPKKTEQPKPIKAEREEEPVAQRASARNAESPKTAAPSTDAESFAYRAAPKKAEPSKPAEPSAAEESFAYRAAAPKKPEAPKPMAASNEDDSFAHRAAPRKPEAKPEPRAEERKPEPRAEARPAEERKPTSNFTSEMWRSHESERKEEEQHVQAEPTEGDDSGLESRFGRLSNSEHVRLKVDPRRAEERRTQERRMEERQAEEPAPVMASSGYNRAPEPTRPYRETEESKPRTTEEHMAAGFAHEAKPLEQPRETYRRSGETAAPRATASERSNLPNQQKETSMYAKGQQQESHENGTATVRSEGANLASIAIERNSKFAGQLKFSGAIAIDGQVEGELVAERVVVHEGGTVNATIEGNTVVIAGTVKGDIYARAELEVLPSGVIHGSVTTPSINVRRGGRIDGRCTIGAPRQ